MRTSVVIPARGGSKGIPGKNLRLVGGLSLVGRSVQHGLSIGEEVFVSTDDTAIAEEAQKAGGQVIWRPGSISGDEASSESALTHAIAEKGLEKDCLIFLQATSPFRETKKIVEATSLILSDQADVCFSAKKGHPFVWRLQESGFAEPVNHPMNYRPRRQELGETFVETGNFYIFRASNFLTHQYRFFGRVVPVPATFEESIDIDEENDLHLAQSLSRFFSDTTGPE